MIDLRAPALLTVLLGTGCVAPLEGTFIGNVECDAIPYQFEIALERQEKRTYVGEGSQFREFTSSGGEVTQEDIQFDVEATLREGSGPQDLITDMTCTAEQRIRLGAGGGDNEIIAEGCAPRRYDDYALGWDGEDALDLLGPDGCSGTLRRR